MKILLTILGIAAVAAYYIVPKLLLDKKLRDIPKLPTDQLKSLCKDPNKSIFVGVALKELTARGEDLIFAFPRALDMALSKNYVQRIFGRGFLREYFRGMIPQIDLSNPKFTKETVQQLEDLRTEMRKRTST
jgi:hypothetical protein